MRYFYRIKVPKLQDETTSAREWEWKVHDCGYIDAKDKKEARKELEDDFGTQLCMRSKRNDIGTKNMYLLALYKPDDYFDNLWNKETNCSHCNNTFTKLQRDKANGFKYIKSFYCSELCEDLGEEKRREQKELEYLENKIDGIHDAVIYKITNKINDKCYIGQTTQAFTFRWYQHFFQAKDTKFHAALKETSITDWIFEVIETFNKDQLKEEIKILSTREQFWIENYNSISGGYNSIAAKDTSDDKQLKINFDEVEDENIGL